MDSFFAVPALEVRAKKIEIPGRLKRFDRIFCISVGGAGAIISGFSRNSPVFFSNKLNCQLRLVKIDRIDILGLTA
jgi:hypothetical protein